MRIKSTLGSLLLCAAMVVGSVQGLWAQTPHQIRGTVTDSAGVPVIGAAVSEEGTSNLSVTGVNGEWELTRRGENPTLVVSLIGYETQTVEVGSRAVVDIVLVQDVTQIDDVVVVGYGTMDKREVSSSIVSVTKSEFLQGAMSTPMEMLTGKVAGLNVNSTALANPNSSPDIQIRGATSVNAGNGPLVIIDGVTGADMRNISPQDIESITVLKDAAASAIYGTRSANGVILVTTKRGASKEGVSNITYESWFGVNVAKDIPEVLSADEFRRSMRTADYGHSTDWYKELLRDFSYDHNQYISMDGRSAKGSYAASLNWRDFKGLDIASARKEYGGRFSVSQKGLNDWVELTANVSARKVEETYGEDGQFSNAITMNPTNPVYNEDGTYYHPTSPANARNPVEQLMAIDRGGDRIYLLGSAEAKVWILKGDNYRLNTSVNYGLQYNDYKEHNYTPSTTTESIQLERRGSAWVQYRKWWTNQLDWLVNFDWSKNGHDLKVLAGYSYVQNDFEGMSMNNYDFAYDDFGWHNMEGGSWLADGRATMNTDKDQSKLVGVFGRVNYSWKNMLMATVSLRRDGSTKFGRDHKWGNFPAVSVAWEMMETPFMKKHEGTINSLKLRASYGETGRSDIGNYKSLATYGNAGTDQGNRTYTYFIDGRWMQGFAPRINANPLLGWETARTFNVGVDFEVLDRRLRGSLDFFDRRSENLIYTAKAPQPPMVYPEILVNLGTTINRGIELMVEGDIFRDSKVNWTSSAIFSWGKSRIEKLNSGGYNVGYLDLYKKPGMGTEESFFRVLNGHDIGEFYGYEHAGVDADGNLLIWGADGEKKTKTQANLDDKRFIGNGTPTTYLSWSNTVRYGRWDMNIFMRGAFGFDIMNFRRYEMGTMATVATNNVLKEAYTKYGDITKDAQILSSFYLENGSYWKIDNITLGYNFTPKNRKIVDNLRVFISAKNVYTFTGYTGNDPSTIGVNGLTPGVDTGNAYPSALQLSAGVTLRFN